MADTTLPSNMHPNLRGTAVSLDPNSDSTNLPPTQYSLFEPNENAYAPVQWHEGMLLTPQHLQQSDFYHHQILTHVLRQVTPYYWGIHHLRLDESQLSHGVLRVLQLSATMPDGSPLYYNAQTDPPLELDLNTLPSAPTVDSGLSATPNANPGASTTNLGVINNVLQNSQIKVATNGTAAGEGTSGDISVIYLAVPAYKSNSNNMAGSLSRFYSIEQTEVYDHNTGDNPITVPKLKLRCYLLPESKVNGNYSAMPLLRINHKAHNALDPTFIAPVTQVKVGSYLADQCSQICTLLKRKALYLSDQIRGRVSPEAAIHLQRQFASLVTDLPQLETMVINGLSHPFQLYNSLAHLLGVLSAAKPEIALLMLPKYYHNQLTRTFQPILQKLYFLLNHIQDNLVKVQFSLDQRIFKLMMRPEWVDRKLYIGVYLNTLNYSDAAEWLESAVIASDYAVSIAKERRIVGARRVIDPQQLEMEIVSSPEVLICEIDVDPMFIRANHELHLFNISEQKHRCPTEVILYTKS